MNFQEKKKDDCASVKNENEYAPTNLLCEHTINPLGIDVTQPRFSWVLNYPERGQFQLACQIFVASSQENLNADNADKWDSGKIAIFEMGLLKSDNWEGKWISGGNLLRKEFTFNKNIKRARAYICGLGYYELRVNGEKVGDHVLDPGWTDYEKRALYVPYDIISYLQRGENAIGIMLGRGRYSPLDEMMKGANLFKRYADSPVLIMQIDIDFTDDSSIRIVTDETWKAAQGPIVEDSIYNGEIYDARLEKLGWDAAEVVDAPEGDLVSQASFPPIKVIKRMQPVMITNPEPDVYIYDFGQNFTGWVRLRLSGPRGTQIKLRYSELLDESGMINTVPNKGAKATDIYILKSEGDEIYEPRFTYHGFRYVEIAGFPGTPILESLEGCVVHSTVEPTGAFICSNPLINRIHKNILWGQLSNLMSIPTDCPQRAERMGWMGDAQLVVEEAIYNFDMASFYTKWIGDIRDAQKEDGSVPDIVPPYWNLYPADPAWGTTCVVVPWYLYLYYGDKQILEQNYLGIKKWVDFLSTQAIDYIIYCKKFGDWCPPRHILSADTPPKVTSTWYYYHDTLILSKIARLLGKLEDADTYLKLSDKIKDAFNRKFFEEDRYTGEKYSKLYKKIEALVPANAPEDKKKEIARELIAKFVAYSQTSNVLSLFLDMVPEDKEKAVVKNLVNDIVVTHSYHLNTGIIGTRYLFDVLTKYGRADLAYKIATQTTYPSWGYMIKEGATTIWERWKDLANAGMNSHNHIMFGTVDPFFYKVLAGINLDPSSPGFKQIIIKPYLIGDLKYISASLKTIKGRVSSSWAKHETSLVLHVDIPCNAKAQVHIPKMGLKEVTVKESGKVVWEKRRFLEKVAGIAGEKEGKNYVIFKVGSGSYSFEVSETPGC